MKQYVATKCLATSEHPNHRLLRCCISMQVQKKPGVLGVGIPTCSLASSPAAVAAAAKTPLRAVRAAF